MHEILVKQIVKAARKGKTVAVLTDKARAVPLLMNQFLGAFDPDEISAVSRVFGSEGIEVWQAGMHRPGRVNFLFRGATPSPIKGDRLYVPLGCNDFRVNNPTGGLVVGYEPN